MSEAIEVVEVPEQHRFEILDDGRTVGFCEYRDNADGTVTMPRTVIDPSMRGRGLGFILVKAAVEEMQSRNLRIIPTCWFVADYLKNESAE